MNQTDENISSDPENTLGGQIARVLKEKGISESKIAKDLGLPYNTIKRLVMGETSDPRYSTLKLISTYLNISIDDLLDNKKNNSVMVPLLSWESVVDYPNNFSSLDLDSWHNWIPISLTTANKINKDSFALKSLPSMAPRFIDNTVFIIDPSVKPMDGDLVLVKFKNTNEISLKDLIIDPPKWIFKSLIDYTSCIPKNEEEHTIIGVVFLTLIYNR